jgi:hypothetical protein
VGDAHLHPRGEVVVGRQVLGRDPQPALHLAAMHHRDGRLARGDEVVAAGWVHADEGATVPAG